MKNCLDDAHLAQPSSGQFYIIINQHIHIGGYWEASAPSRPVAKATMIKVIQCA
jgi:hypothetical protein